MGFSLQTDRSWPYIAGDQDRVSRIETTGLMNSEIKRSDANVRAIKNELT